MKITAPGCCYVRVSPFEMVRDCLFPHSYCSQFVYVWFLFFVMGLHCMIDLISVSVLFSYLV
uniref:Uncharacterized protein n=1 Tax=Anguilla anguilla TaxID=7936 RepID=A0A0E9UKN9_ANGAN